MMTEKELFDLCVETLKTYKTEKRNGVFTPEDLIKLDLILKAVGWTKKGRKMIINKIK